MNKVLLGLVLLCTVGMVLPSFAEDTPADAPAAATVESATPAAVTATAESTTPAEPAAAAAAPKLDSGNTAWMLAATALVLFMTIPGLALFYGGMVRKKNVLATLMQSFAITSVVTILWVVLGYSIAFTEGNGFMGGFSQVFLKNMAVDSLSGTIPESVFMMFQLTFAIITPALIAGAFAERMKFSAMLLFMSAWSIVVYAPIAHWVWGPHGWLLDKGVLDYAGGTVVHINAGIAGLACAIMLGKRIGYGKEALMPHNLILTLIGASMLWVGWFGFNAGSALAADSRAGMAMAVTQIAAAAAALAWMFAEWFAKRKPSLLGIASGAIAGLVAITPASGFVGPGPAIIIGLAAGILCYFSATWLKKKLGYDDSLDAFGVHGIGGIVGAILTGVFASKAIGGVEGNVATQLIGIGATLVYGLVASLIILKVIDVTVGLRVNEEQEREGLDISLHGERVE